MKFAKSYQPQIEFAFYGWLSDITLTIKGNVQINNEGIATFPNKRNIKFLGVIEPWKPRNLEIKSYQQRAYSKYCIFTYKKIALNNGDRIEYNNKSYKILDLSDYSLNNYYYYELVEDFEDTP